jgi:hypothetical protein
LSVHDLSSSRPAFRVNKYSPRSFWQTKRKARTRFPAGSTLQLKRSA